MLPGVLQTSSREPADRWCCPADGHGLHNASDSRKKSNLQLWNVLPLHYGHMRPSPGPEPVVYMMTHTDRNCSLRGTAQSYVHILCEIVMFVVLLELRLGSISGVSASIIIG